MRKHSICTHTHSCSDSLSTLSFCHSLYGLLFVGLGTWAVLANVPTATCRLHAYWCCIAPGTVCSQITKQWIKPDFFLLRLTLTPTLHFEPNLRHASMSNMRWCTCKTVFFLHRLSQNTYCLYYVTDFRVISVPNELVAYHCAYKCLKGHRNKYMHGQVVFTRIVIANHLNPLGIPL